MTNKNIGKHIFFAVSLLVFVLMFFFGYSINSKRSLSASELRADKYIGLKEYKEIELKRFDGSSNSEPIYIGLNGLIYDVSSGRDYYKVDGPYHYLAGKDSSNELNLIGGGIIKKKYPVIGILVK